MSHTDTTITTNAYFDLKSYIQNVQCPDVAAQMAQSAAFACDVGIQTAVRALMKMLRMHHDAYGIDSIDAMTVAMREAAFTEKVIRMAGKDDLGPVATIVQLNHVRQTWHQLAADLTGMTFDWQGIPRSYEIRPMEEILSREVKVGVRPDTERKIRLTVQRRADDANKDDIEAVIQRRLQREQARAKDVSQALMDQRETLVTLYRTVIELADAGEFDELDITHTSSETFHATVDVEDSVGKWSKKNMRISRTADTDGEIEFHDLDVSLQRSMIEGAMRGAARAEEYATQSSSMTDAEFDAVSFAVIRVERELKAVLLSPKFVVQQRKADAGRALSV